MPPSKGFMAIFLLLAIVANDLNGLAGKDLRELLLGPFNELSIDVLRRKAARFLDLSKVVLVGFEVVPKRLEGDPVSSKGSLKIIAMWNSTMFGKDLVQRGIKIIAFENEHH